MLKTTANSSTGALIGELRYKAWGEAAVFLGDYLHQPQVHRATEREFARWFGRDV